MKILAKEEENFKIDRILHWSLDVSLVIMLTDTHDITKNPLYYFYSNRVHNTILARKSLRDEIEF